jgi:hypothetical protein
MKDIDDQIANIEKQIREKPDDPGTPQLKEKLNALRIRHAELALRSEGFYAEGVSITVADVAELGWPKFETTGKVSVTVSGKDTDVHHLRVIDPTRFLAEAQMEANRTVDLQGSLPEDAALQPGNTAVYTIIMNTKNPLLFRPSQYRLQFSVNYGFEKKPEDSDEWENLYTNTVATTLSIRASIYSVIIGAAGGGLFGSLARLLQSPTFTIQTLPESFISLVLSLLLSVVAIIFLARKSGVQSFVSVEDFWGGLLIGFLVGYSGASFFQELTGMSTLPGT